MSRPVDPVAGRPVLLLLPTPRDVAVARDVLARHGITAEACDGPDALEAGLEAAGAVVICEEWLLQGAHEVLVRALARQPAWSDLPIVVVTRDGADSAQASDAMAALGNVSLLERPLRMTALVSTVRAALRARRRQLELREHLDTLRAHGEQFAAAAQRKDAMLAMLAHELRNPLAPVRNALHVLRAAPADAATTAALHATMERQVDHLVRLVNDLLAMAQVTHDKIELRRAAVPVATLIDEAVAMVRDALDAAGHTLVVTPPAPALAIDGDRDRLVQALCNVLDNAVRYTPPQGRIEVSGVADGDTVRLVVRDTGIGIDPAMLPHVFELFAQGARREHRTRDGLGIGLTLVQQLVALHGGRVHAESDGPGCGTAFTLVLPRAQAEAVDAPEPAESTAASPGAAPVDVLVVDDNVDAAQALGLLVDMLGHRTRVHVDGHQALAALAQAPLPDVALLDLGMPGLDGIALARRLRALPGGGAIRLAAVTGWDGAEDRARTREAGFDAHFSKPVDADALQRFLAAPGVMHAADAA